MECLQLNAVYSESPVNRDCIFKASQVVAFNSGYLAMVVIVLPQPIVV